MLLYNIKQLIRNGVHIGHYTWECDYRLSFFLLGVRNLIHIINIYYTIYILKQALYIIYNMGILGQRVLVINNFGYELNCKFKKMPLLCGYINEKWIGGLLTNQKMIYYNNEDLFLKFYGLGRTSTLPGYVFASNIEKTGSSIFESIILDIPSSSLLDSNQGFYGIFYPICSNDESYVSITLFTKIFIKIFWKSMLDIKNLFNVQKNKFFQKFKRAKKKLFIKYKWYKPYNLVYQVKLLYNRIRAIQKNKKRNSKHRKFLINLIKEKTLKHMRNSKNIWFVEMKWKYLRYFNIKNFFRKRLPKGVEYLKNQKEKHLIKRVLRRISSRGNINKRSKV